MNAIRQDYGIRLLKACNDLDHAKDLLIEFLEGKRA